MTTTPDTAMHRLWDQGQHHLAAGRYIAARTALQTAEAIAWRNHDARSLARLYLPLLEARRLIRYAAADGLILICPPNITPQQEHKLLTHFLHQPAGTILLTCNPTTPHQKSPSTLQAICHLAGSVHFAARRTSHWLEALLLIQHQNEIRLASPAHPTFAAGLPIQWTATPAAAIANSTDPNLHIPLPPPGTYPATQKSGTAAPGGDPSPQLHALARESLIIAWEALALHWQHHHPPPSLHNTPKDKTAAPWQEMAWLRLALRIDPACEPITMRLISLAEAIERQK